MNRDELLSIARDELYTAVLSDTLDSLGHLGQAFAPGIAPLAETMRIAGFARTGLYMPIFHDAPDMNVYENEIALVDDLKPGDVVMLSCSDNPRIGPWGELLSTRAQFLKSAGCITDGCVRDVGLIQEMAFPVFTAAYSPLDTKHRGKMMWRDVPIVMRGVKIESGDLVFADQDGIVVVPKAITEEVVSKALAKVRTETTIRQELQEGATLAEVFDRHGIL